VSIDAFPGFDPRNEYKDVRGLSVEGAFLFRVLEIALSRRSIEVITSCRARRLLLDGDGRIAGVAATYHGETAEFRADRGVVLACGGFEADDDLQRQYWRGGAAMSAAFLGNVGDGVRMAQAVGADLWHMWHYHGSYGFKDPRGSWPLGIRVRRFPDWIPGIGPRQDVIVSWILVDRAGKRFMSEYPPYLHDTGARDLDHYSFDECDHPRIPSWLIVDSAGIDRYPLGGPIYHGNFVPFDWTPDNRSAIEAGILRPAGSIDELAHAMGTSARVLRATIDRWNAMCCRKVDEDHRRPGSTMVPIDRPPYYVGAVWPVVSNTQGGPRHDHRQRVLDVFGKPIPGLFSAGEIGSCFGYLYLSGGNLAECFVGGHIAGCEAADCVEAAAW
jgi:succinate dehydrogenase/fumarate reductase flavoprotein subunit